MGSSRQWMVGIAAATLALCGFGARWAAEDGLYATCAALALVGLWVGTAWTWNGRAVAAPKAAGSPNALEAATAELRVLANLLDQAPAPMLTLHADGAVRAANRAARRLFQADDLLVDAPRPLLEAFAPDGAGARRRVVDLGAKDRPQVYAMSATDFVGPRGVRRLAVLLDIQPELQAAEAAAARELMGVLSHEIMNGLTPIASLAATAADLLADPGAEGADQAREAVATLARRSEGLSRFVTAYRTLAQLPPPVLRPTGLTSLLLDARRLFEARWGGRVHLKLEPPTPDIIASMDEEQIQRALANLLTNAAEAALHSSSGAPRILLSAHFQDQATVLSVQDNGPGVAAADRDRVFEPFFSTKPAGAGIGLSLARHIARAHGGELILSRSDEGGAKFEVLVP